jgi:hypothetical protein
MGGGRDCECGDIVLATATESPPEDNLSSRLCERRALIMESSFKIARTYMQ